MRSFAIHSVVLGLALIILNFNSCDNYSESSLFNQASTAGCSVDFNCEFSTDDLMLHVNSEIDFLIDIDTNQTVSRINIGGVCNTGDYIDGIIRWRVMLDGLPRQTSESAGAFPGRCDSGRFTLLVEIPPDLDDGRGVKRTHELVIDFFGIDEQGNEYQNPLNRRTLNLVPNLL